MAIPYRLIDSSSRKVHTSNDIEQESYLGLSMPLRNSEITGSIGYFESTNYTLDAIRENIKNILSTHKKERIFRPSIGVAWNKYLFQPVTPQLLNSVKAEIRSAILQWMPFLKLQSIQLDREEEGEGVLIYIKLVIVYNDEIMPMIFSMPTFSNESSY